MAAKEKCSKMVLQYTSSYIVCKYNIKVIIIINAVTIKLEKKSFSFLFIRAASIS